MEAFKPCKPQASPGKTVQKIGAESIQAKVQADPGQSMAVEGECGGLTLERLDNGGCSKAA